MKKRKLIACAVLIASLSMGAYGTYAYFVADDTATNVITSGNVDITLKQTMIPEAGKPAIPLEEVVAVMPGRKVSQIVQVENTGNQPAYIRVKVEKEILLADGITDQPDLSLVSYNVNTENWTEKDGYYYYKEVLAAGATTEALFTEVQFDKAMGNMYQNSKADLKVNAQATQVVHNGGNVMEAQGWPAEE